MNYKGFIGTYTSDISEGIYSFELNENKFLDVALLTKIKNPKYLTFIDGKIACVCDFDQGSGVMIIDEQGKEISRLIFENKTSCYITYKDKHLFTTNYHEGTFNVISVNENYVLKLIKQIKIKDKAGCHQVLFYKDLYLIPCLLMDKIMIFNKDYSQVDEINFKALSGPRHGIFSNDNKYLYIACELNNYLYAINMETRKIVNEIAILPKKYQGKDSCAAIRLLKDRLYISVRGSNLISIIKIINDKFIYQDIIETIGDHPRDFEIMGNRLFVVNKNSNNLVSLSLKNKNNSENIISTVIPEGVAIIVKENI